MIRSALTCFMLCGLWLCITPARAEQALPGSGPDGGAAHPHVIELAPVV